MRNAVARFISCIKRPHRPAILRAYHYNGGSKMVAKTQVATQDPALDLGVIKQRQQQTWGSGDFDRVAVNIMITAELLCEAVDVHPGQEVLDVACGSGNAAIAAARRFCRVTGVDYVPALLERARARAEFERL